MDANITVMASFEPTGISCNAGYSQDVHDYDEDTMVTLTASPAGGSTFSGWSGGADCSSGQVTMDSDTNCTATFVDPTPNCAGADFGGYCWYHGAENLSCTEVCTSHGGYHEGFQQ